jgi:hypothetical protein
MADVIGGYKLLWISGSFSSGFYTTGNFAPGTNVFVSTAISNVRADTNDSIWAASIFNWSVYGPGGQISPVNPNPDAFRNTMYIDNCANITFAVSGQGGYCQLQATVFRR